MTRFTFLLLAILAAKLCAQVGFTPVHSGLNGTPQLNGITGGNAGLVAVGDTGTIFYSVTGIAWQSVPSGVTANLTGVAYGPAGFVAVGDSGLILVSKDGQSWKSVQQTATTARLNSVACDGLTYVTVGERGTSLQSTTGTAWTSVPTGTTQALRSVAAGYSNGTWVCAGTGGTMFYRTLGGISWRTVSTGTTTDFSAVTATQYHVRDIILAGLDPGWTFGAVGADGNYYSITVVIPGPSAVVSTVPINGSDSLRALIGAGLWSNGQAIYDIAVGYTVQPAEILAFGASGSSYRTLGTQTAQSTVWQANNTPFSSSINGAWANVSDNSVYVVGQNGAIFHQANVFRSRLANFSVRGDLSGGASETMGFVTDGTGIGSKSMLVRAVGPGLATFGISSPLPAPQLSVQNQAGQSLGFNGGWLPPLANTFSQVGAFPLVPGSSDAALQVGISLGSASLAAITALPNLHGTVLAELYDADPAVDGVASIVNASALVQVPAQGSVTVGFTIQGPAQPSLLLRAVGPALGSFGLTGVLPDPVLTANTFVAPGAPVETFFTSPFTTAQATTATGAFPLPTSGQNPILLAQGSGEFTATISSASGASGTVLVELYLVPLPLGPVAQF